MAEQRSSVGQVMVISRRRAAWPRHILRRRKARWSSQWQPRWKVCRMADSFPAQNVGSPVRLPEGLEAGPALMLQKARCEGHSLGGFVLGNSGLARSGALYFRQAAPQILYKEKMDMPGAWLCLPFAAVAEEEPAKTAESSRLRVVVIASQDEFLETAYRDPEVDVSMAGNGRRAATQAMLRCLLRDTLRAESSFVLVALLILDHQAALVEGQSTLVPTTPLPSEGPEIMEVHLPGFGPIEAHRGDLEQLLVSGAGELSADIAISTSLRRDMLTLLHGAVTARVHIAMGHDYNLPYGPWGVREAWPVAHEAHCRLLDRTKILATSRHLAEFLQRWSQGRVDARVCYCADYGYFDRFLHPSGNSAKGGEYITFISPCPAKGLCIFLRLAKDLPSARFRAVTTVWTKSIHEQLLRELPNVRISAGRKDVESIYQKTAVLVVPSIWSEAFGLVAIEAQLRGIPVVSSGHYGLTEANMLEEFQVPDVRLVQDMKIRTLHRGQTIDELERSLPHARKEPGETEEEKKQHVAHGHFYVASEEEAKGFHDRVVRLVQNPSWRREKGQEAKRKAEAFVESRRGQFLTLLAGLGQRRVQT
mmetsp:Transcript_5398/g.12441  ORF Transcript_5398/g.12441 Transcript_5398/m.12441 type:complete len:591 (-) Transcript_5398:87-1859(-)